MQRIWLIAECSFLALCLFCQSSFAQDTKVKVGVTALGRASGLSGAAGRDRLVKSLNKQKKSQIEAIPVEGDQVSDEARQKNCAFVVVTTQTEMQAGSEVDFGRTSTANIPKYKVAVEYKLYRSFGWNGRGQRFCQGRRHGVAAGCRRTGAGQRC